MIAKYAKFLSVKLILILFAAAGSGVASLLFSMTVGENTDPAFARIITRAVPAIVFFAFIYSFESKIKVPKVVLDARYFCTFTLRETSAYAIFMIPVTVIAEFVDGGAAEYLLSPQLIAHSFGLSIPVNYVCVVAAYALIALLAHYMKSKKRRPSAVDNGDLTGTYTETESDDSESADEINKTEIIEETEEHNDET